MSLGVRLGIGERLHSYGFYVQGEDRKGQSSIRVETGQCFFTEQERHF